MCALERDCVLLASAASRKALAIAVSLRRILGVRVAGVFHRRHPHVLSRFFSDKVVVCVDRLSRMWPRVVVDAALKLGCRLVIPVDYVDVEVLSRFRSLFEEAGVALASPPYDSVVYAANKYALNSIMEGIARTPRTILVENGGSGFTGVSGIEPPVVVKGVGDAARPSYHLDLESAARDALSRAPCIIQEYTPGVARGYYTVSFNGEPILEFTHQRIVEYEPSGGPSLAAKGSILDPELYRIGRMVVSRLRWTGPLMVETKWDPETGEYCVIELNPKFWGSLALPVTLGYHFPAVLAKAFLDGVDEARILASKLVVGRGAYSWVLDGIRYLASVPEAWFRLSRIALENPFRNELSPIDPGRVLMQVLYGVESLPRRRVLWRRRLSSIVEGLKPWFRRLLENIRVGGLSVILDLDGTLFQLPVEWSVVREELVREGLARRWESIQSALTRLWRTDRRGYEEASRIIEEHELNAIDKARALVDAGVLEELWERGVRMCIATKQSARVVSRLLGEHGLRRLIEHVAARDTGSGPLKRHLLVNCVERVGSRAVVVDDNMKAIVEAARLGLLPMRASWSLYRRIQALELGVPAAPTSDLLSMVVGVVDRLGSRVC